MPFFKAFEENLENFKSPYVKRCEPVLGMPRTYIKYPPSLFSRSVYGFTLSAKFTPVSEFHFGIVLYDID